MTRLWKPFISMQPIFFTMKESQEHSETVYAWKLLNSIVTTLLIFLCMDYNLASPSSISYAFSARGWNNFSYAWTTISQIWFVSFFFGSLTVADVQIVRHPLPRHSCERIICVRYISNTMSDQSTAVPTTTRWTLLVGAVRPYPR